jgi:hypothetical protein
MLKKGKINIGALLLLLIYIFSNIPFALLHQHHNHIVAYEKANACEKSIYYGSNKGDCGHTTHISKTVKHCPLCEHHIITPHIGENFNSNLFHLFYYSSYKITNTNCLLSSSFVISNKGPPTV